MTHCDEDSRDPNDDHWIFEELGSPIKSRKRRLPHRNGAVKTCRTVSTSTEHTPTDKDSFDEKLKIYADNMRKLIITARKEINSLKEENIALKQKLESSGTIQCPACLFLFRPQEEHKVFPKYIKVFRGRLCLEIEFNTLEQMNHWLNANHLDVNADGLPTVIAESKRDDLVSTGSLLPQLIEKRGLETNKERIVISTRPQQINETSVNSEPARKVSNYCGDYQSPSTSSQHHVSAEVHEIHRAYEEDRFDAEEGQNLPETYTFDRRIEKNSVESNTGRSGPNRDSAARRVDVRAALEKENLVQKSCDSVRSGVRQCSRSSTEASTGIAELRESSSAHDIKKDISNKENLHGNESARKISDKSKTQITKRSRAVRKSLSTRKSRHDLSSTRCGSDHSGTRSRNGHRVVRDANGHLRSNQNSLSTSHSYRTTHDMKERLRTDDKRSKKDDVVQNHESKSTLTLREFSPKHSFSQVAQRDCNSRRDVRSKERGMEPSSRGAAKIERNDRYGANSRSRSKESFRKRAGRDCVVGSPDSKRRRSPPRNENDVLDQSDPSSKVESPASSDYAKLDDDNNNDDIDSLSDADLVIIDEEEVEDGEILD